VLKAPPWRPIGVLTAPTIQASFIRVTILL